MSEEDSVATFLLKQLLEEKEIACVAGAHDALSARLAQMAGFDAVWLSSLGLSTVRGLPDLNLLSSAEITDATRDVASRIRIPLIVDGEDGHGDVNNVMHFVREIERSGAAAICFDDNEYPKRNSFYGGRRTLVSRERLAGKIRAATSVRASKDFFVIARTEAMIAGLGVAEAVIRAKSCVDAGADALVVHSRHWAEIRAFMKEWRSGATPLIVIPTGFPDVSISEMKEAGFKVVIYANQSLRASVKAMERILRDLRAAETRSALEDDIASLQTLEFIVGLQQFSEDQEIT